MSFVSFEDAQPLIEEHRDDLPGELRNRSFEEIEAAWPEWVQRRDQEIRARVARGEEDSLVNLWLFGTRFTARPRVTARAVGELGAGDTVEGLLLARLDDLIAAMRSPNAGERVRLARGLLDRRGIDLGSENGIDAARHYIIGLRERVIAENEEYRRELEAARRLADPESRLRAYASVYTARGLSSDTSLLADFAVDRAVAEAAARGALAPGSVRRVAIIGPGLDFTDKAEGHDFYPVQTIQPFALIDSLLRAGVIAAGGVQVTTFDLSARVNRHLTAAVSRAESGTPYLITLPIDANPPSAWSNGAVDFWQHTGTAIGDTVTAAAPPAGAGAVRVRAIAVSPDVVRALRPHDLNVIVQRLDLDAADRYDLVVATNVLVYYSAFEQALALVNVASMTRPGGFLLTNYALTVPMGMTPAPELTTSVFWDEAGNGDTMLWYRRAAVPRLAE